MEVEDVWYPVKSFIVISKIFNTSMPIIIVSIPKVIHYLLKTKPTLYTHDMTIERSDITYRLSSL